jgi:hypothetical protein
MYGDPIKGQVVDTDIAPANPGHEPYVIVSVINTGGSAVGVEQVGIKGTNNLVVSSSAVFCSDPKPQPLAKCAFPILIEPQQTADFYVLLDDSLKQSVECFNSVFSETRPNDVQFALLAANGSVYSVDTGASIYWYDQCSGTQSPSPPASTSSR